jgi:hypothetical protein
MFQEIRKRLFAGFLASDIDQLGSILSRLHANADFLYQDQAAGDQRRDKTHAKLANPIGQGKQK